MTSPRRLVPILVALAAASAAAPARAADPVIAAAGDIACDPLQASYNGGNGTSNSCHMKQVSDLLVGQGYAAVLPLGDNTYYCGSLKAFRQSYGPTWGRVLGITRPVVGNHEYLTTPAADRTDCTQANAGAAGYFDYFGAAAGERGKGYYSYDLGSWHLIALNSNCSDAGGCSTTSPQGRWLAADLAANAKPCTLAYWHIPLYSSGGRASGNMRTIWAQLQAAGVDVALTGHDHTYERFALQNQNGGLDASGIREFVVGTGGANHTTFGAIAANSMARNASTYGILRMALHAASYEWTFVPEAGASYTDAGSTTCHRATGDRTPPSPPAGLTATPASATRVDLAWGAATDDTGVTGYRILRDGTQIGTTDAATRTFPDTGVKGGTTYAYEVRAEDAAGNVGAGAVASASTPAGATVTLLPVADTFVDATTPTTAYGTGAQLVADASPQRRILLRFAVSGLVGRTIGSVRLRLFCQNGSPAGGTLHRVASQAWDEATTTWSNAPPADAAVLGTLPRVSAGTWYEVDLGGLVTGDGTYTVDVTSANADGAYYGSRTGTPGQEPQLVIVSS